MLHVLLELKKLSLCFFLFLWQMMIKCWRDELSFCNASVTAQWVCSSSCPKPRVYFKKSFWMCRFHLVILKAAFHFLLCANLLITSYLLSTPIMDSVEVNLLSSLRISRLHAVFVTYLMSSTDFLQLTHPTNIPKIIAKWSMKECYNSAQTHLLMVAFIDSVTTAVKCTFI